MRRGGGYVRLPPFGAGQTIGLFGGSFNPPHRGHLLASQLALNKARLDRVWWLATPGNPLKSRADLAALRARLDAARALVHDPRIAVTGFESEIGSRFTFDTLALSALRASGARFVWIMGADNLGAISPLARTGAKSPKPRRFWWSTGRGRASRRYRAGRRKRWRAGAARKATRRGSLFWRRRHGFFCTGRGRTRHRRRCGAVFVSPRRSG